MADVPPISDVVDAHVLLYLGDAVSTDHISLAGSIAKNTPAGQYLASKGYVLRLNIHCLVLDSAALCSVDDVYSHSSTNSANRTAPHGPWEL